MQTSKNFGFEGGVRVCQSCECFSSIQLFSSVLGKRGAPSVCAPLELLLGGFRERPVQVIVLTRPEIHSTFQPLGDHRRLRLLLHIAVRLLAVPQVLLHDVVLVFVLGERVVFTFGARGGGVLFGGFLGFSHCIAVVHGEVAVRAWIWGRVALLPDAVVRADAEVLHVALDLAVVRFDEVAPGLPLGLPTRVFQFSSPVRKPVADLQK